MHVTVQDMTVNRNQSILILELAYTQHLNDYASDGREKLSKVCLFRLINEFELIANKIVVFILQFIHVFNALDMESSNILLILKTVTPLEPLTEI